MNKKKSIKEVLWKFGCGRAPTLEDITTYLGVNTTESIVTMDKSVIKKIKRRMTILVNSNNTAED